MNRIGAMFTSLLLLVSLANLGPVSGQQNDWNSGTDAGDSLSQALAISPGTGMGYLDLTDTSDYYKVSVLSGQTIDVILTPPFGSDFDLALYDLNQLQVASSSYGGSQTDWVSHVATATGYYYIQVDQWSGSGIYTLQVTVAGGEAQNDWNSGTDAGNTLAQALTISPGTSTGYLDSADTGDYYKVNVSSGQTIEVSLTPPSGSDFDLALYDLGQFEVASSTLGGSQTDTVTHTATSSGYFYIHVYQWSGSGIYSLTVTVAGGTTQDDANSGTDAGNSFGQALRIPAGSFTGYIDSTDTIDYYKVSVSAGQMMMVALAPPSGADFDLYLYDPDQTQVASSTLAGDLWEWVTYTATSTGDYFIAIEQWSGSGVYSFEVWLSSIAIQNDWNSGTDAGNSFDQALAISFGTGTGYVDSTDADDYYKVNVTAGGEISAILTPPSNADFDLALYDPNHTQVASSTLGVGEVDSVSYTATSTGDWYIRVNCYSGSGIYTLQVSATSATALAESPHPYPNNYDRWWTISETGAGQIRAHFTQLDVEQGWDYVYIYDGDYNLITGYTGSYRDLWTDWVTGSTIRVRLVSDSSVTAYGFTIDSKETGAAPPPPAGNKFAILVGVNDYADPSVNDLVGCVEDAMDWRSYLVSKGYQISYFLADSQATEANIKAAIANVVARTGPDSTIVFSFSGHGGKSDEVGLPPGNSALCCHDSGWGTSGNLTDTELQQAFSGYTGKLFVFLDSCRSGGMNEVATGSRRYMTTTCSDDGYGFGIPWYQNGAWGYWFCDRGLLHGWSGQQDMEGNFTWARSSYINDILAGTEYDTQNNYPMQFDGDLADLFYL